MIIKNSIVLAIFSALSILLGIVRDRLLATHVGVGPVLDIYNASFRLPDFLYALSLAFITAGTVVPFLTQEDKHGHVVDSRHKLSSLSLFFSGIISLLGIIIAITIPLYAKYIVPGFTSEQISVFIDITRLLMVQPLLIGLSSLISCFAQMRNEFVLYGIAPLGYSLGIIGGIIYFFPHYGEKGLIYGVLIGALLSLCIQAWSLRNAKMFEVFPYFSLKHIKEIVKLGFPRTGTNVLTQSRTMFFTAFATTLGPGALTSYLFAQRITDAVVQIIQQSVTTASLPVLAKEYIENRVEEHEKVVHKYVLLLGLIGVLASTCIYFFRDEVIWLLYGNTNARGLIEFFLGGFLIILPFTMATGYFSISLYSIKDTKSVFFSNLIGTVAAIIVCYNFRTQGAISLIYGFVAMAIVNFIVIFFLYKKNNLMARLAKL